MGERANRTTTKRVVVRNIPNQLGARVEEQMPDFEDDLLDPPDPPQYNPRRLDPLKRGRIRQEYPQRQSKLDIKLDAYVFAGNVNLEVYIDWERRMEYIFECYGYSVQKKIARISCWKTHWERLVLVGSRGG